MKTFTYTEAKEIINTLGRFTVSSWTNQQMAVIDTESGEYSIGTDNEADDAWEIELDNYLTEVIYPELDDSVRNYFNDEAWKRDARCDGRGRVLSPYDGSEIEFNKCDLYAFRMN